MKFWVVSNPLPQVNAPKCRMYEVNPNPSYKCFKYTKGFVGIRVSNVVNCKEIIEILNRNWGEFEYRVQKILILIFHVIISSIYTYVLYTIIQLIHHIHPCI